MFIFYILSFLLFSSDTNSQRCTSDQDCPTNYYCSVLNGCISSGNTLESACVVNPCQQNCRCVQSRIHGSGFYCDSPGFLGKTCTIPKPTLDCGANRILITISDKILKEYGMVPGNSYVRMGTIPPFRSTSLDFDQCSINTSSNGLFTYTVPLPFQSCGTSTFTKTSTNELTQVFTNEVWLNTKGMLFDVPVPIFRWTCAYSLDYSLVTSLIPAVDPISVIKGDTHVTPAYIELCKVPVCPSACPPIYMVNNGAIYTVSEIIHVSLTMESPTYNPQNVVYVEDLYLSCDSQPGIVEVSLVEGGCSTNTLSVMIGHNGQGRTVCVSFRVPRLLSCTMFYVHGKLSSIRKSLLQSCVGGTDATPESVSGKMRRSLETFVTNTSKVQIGPIYTIAGSNGAAKSEMFPGAAIDANTNVSIVDKTTGSMHIQPSSSIAMDPNSTLNQQVLVVGTSILGSGALLFCISMWAYFLTRAAK